MVRVLVWGRSEVQILGDDSVTLVWLRIIIGGLRLDFGQPTRENVWWILHLCSLLVNLSKPLGIGYYRNYYSHVLVEFVHCCNTAQT